MDNDKMRKLAREKYPGPNGGIDWQGMGKENSIGRTTLQTYINYDRNNCSKLPKLDTASLIALALDVEMNEIFDDADISDFNGGPEAGNATNPDYSKEHRDKMREYYKKWFQENPEYPKKYYEEHKDRISKRRIKYYEEHGNEMREKRNKYYQKNKSKSAAIGRLTGALNNVIQSRE